MNLTDFALKISNWKEKLFDKNKTKQTFRWVCLTEPTTIPSETPNWFKYCPSYKENCCYFRWLGQVKVFCAPLYVSPLSPSAKTASLSPWSKMTWLLPFASWSSKSNPSPELWSWGPPLLLILAAFCPKGATWLCHFLFFSKPQNGKNFYFLYNLHCKPTKNVDLDTKNKWLAVSFPSRHHHLHCLTNGHYGANPMHFIHCAICIVVCDAAVPPVVRNV